MEEADVTLSVPAARERPKRIKFITGGFSAGRFDRSNLSWRLSIMRLIRLKLIFLFGTEAAGRDNKQFRSALSHFNWDYVHLSGAAVGECWGMWNAQYVELMAKPFAAKLSDMTWTRSEEYGGKDTKPIHGLVIPLKARKGKKQWVFVISHDPTDKTEHRQEVWVDVQKGKVELNDRLELRFPDAEIIFFADVNKNLKQPNESFQVARYIEHPMKKLSSWRGRMPRSGGTHGNDVIDMGFADSGVFVDCQLVKDDSSSDHRPFKFRLSGRLRKMVTKLKR